MDIQTIFDGQQTDEKILTSFHQHPYKLVISIIGSILLSLFLFVMSFAVSSLFLGFSNYVILFGSILSIILGAGGTFWFINYFQKSITYITDRRIMRFEVVSPVYISKRSLFWTETLKAKAFSKNLILRINKIGNLTVEPQAATNEKIDITDIYLYEDLANYIDKIIYIVKNTPDKISELKPFIFAPKGQRE